MSLTAFGGLGWVGAGLEDDISDDPKMSAKRSWVFWAEARWSSALVGVNPPVVDVSSPMRSTSESLSARVDPTLRFSETVS